MYARPVNCRFKQPTGLPSRIPFAGAASFGCLSRDHGPEGIVEAAAEEGHAAGPPRACRMSCGLLYLNLSRLISVLWRGFQDRDRPMTNDVGFEIPKLSDQEKAKYKNFWSRYKSGSFERFGFV